MLAGNGLGGYGVLIFGDICGESAVGQYPTVVLSLGERENGRPSYPHSYGFRRPAGDNWFVGSKIRLAVGLGLRLRRARPAARAGKNRAGASW